MSTRAGKLTAAVCGIAAFGTLVVVAATALKPTPLVQATWLPDAGSAVIVTGNLSSDGDRTTRAGANGQPAADDALPPADNVTPSSVENTADDITATSAEATEALTADATAASSDPSITGDGNGAGVGSMNFGYAPAPSAPQFAAQPDGGAGNMAPGGGPHMWAPTSGPALVTPSSPGAPVAVLPGPSILSTVVPTSSSPVSPPQVQVPPGGTPGPSQQTSKTDASGQKTTSQQTSKPDPSGQQTTQGQTADNPVKPSNDGPVFELPITACSGKTCQSWQYFDPVVAIGYNYELKPTDPSSALTFGITAIKIPTKIGDGKYELYLYNVITGSYVDVGQEIDADPNNSFDVVAYLQSLNPAQDAEFGISDPEMGLSQFSIRGIDPAAGLDPNDTNAFITGLLFTGEINGNLFITPLTVDTDQGGDGVVAVADAPARDIEVVSEPHSLSVFVLGLLLMLFGIRHRRKADW